jgi:hypothetical protein
MMIATWRGSWVESSNIRARFPVPQPGGFVDAASDRVCIVEPQGID